MSSFATLSVRGALIDAETPPVAFDLTQYGITVADIRRNRSPCDIADTGTIIAISGVTTGRTLIGAAHKLVRLFRDHLDSLPTGPVPTYTLPGPRLNNS